MTARSFEFDSVLDEHDLATVRAALEAHPGYEMIISRQVSAGFGAGFLQRHDVFRNFLRTGGVSGRSVDLRDISDRTNFFRATFAYGQRVDVPGVEPYLHSERLAQAAADLYDAPVVEPAIVFVNLMLPGQELGPHADVPEFRGLSRDDVPEWLLVVMHHSGLFADERVPIATAVSWFGHAAGGAFCYWPDGPAGPRRQIATHDNHAVLLDTDTVFHAVAPITRRDPSERPLLEIGVRVAWSAEHERWLVTFQGNELLRLHRDEVRVSLSWKARCFQSEAERDHVTHAKQRGEGLSLDTVLSRLRQDLHQRGQLASPDASLDERALIVTLLDTYLNFPPSS
ncbi:hypothetical protein [Enhygromyxa salina]|uniref:Uncharacterized protein n=1 Tax=Enhygromyxa salina TaxID=215803 RepID=A0A2S9YQ92_9BACT|nr:hypothetical protein [Enhygromyxa salina]PRQ07248.1 hypothetical protein ENSA7_29560 [Enhygromyxa salina]